MDTVNLRPLEEDDALKIITWRNKEYVRRYLYNQGLLTEEMQKNYYKKYISTGLIKQYIISAAGRETNDSNIVDIGTVFLKNIDYFNNKAEVGIFIGDEAYLGCGIGTASIGQILEIAFRQLMLNKVYSSVMAENVSSKKIFLKNNFTEVGYLKDDVLINEKYIDVVLLEITSAMWEKSK